MKESEEDYYQALGVAVSMAAYRQGMTIAQLSRAAGIPDRTLRDIYDGKHKISALNIARLCVAMGLDADELLGIRRINERLQHQGVEPADVQAGQHHGA